jgi:L-cysteine desulfidase
MISSADISTGGTKQEKALQIVPREEVKQYRLDVNPVCNVTHCYTYHGRIWISERMTIHFVVHTAQNISAMNGLEKIISSAFIMDQERETTIRVSLHCFVKYVENREPSQIMMLFRHIQKQNTLVVIQTLNQSGLPQYQVIRAPPLPLSYKMTIKG